MKRKSHVRAGISRTINHNCRDFHTKEGPADQCVCVCNEIMKTVNKWSQLKLLGRKWLLKQTHWINTKFDRHWRMTTKQVNRSPTVSSFVEIRPFSVNCQIAWKIRSSSTKFASMYTPHSPFHSNNKVHQCTHHWKESLPEQQRNWLSSPKNNAFGVVIAKSPTCDLVGADD